MKKESIHKGHSVEVCLLWDCETQAYWPIVECDGKLYGFPDSRKDGVEKGTVALGVLYGAYQL